MGSEQRSQGRQPIVLSPVDAVLLDLDGTLVHSDAVVERCWRRWAASVGVEPETFVGGVHGRIGADVMAELLPERAHELNASDDAEMLRWEIEDTDGVVPVAGASELVTALDGVPWAIVTSCTEPLARARLAAAGLRPPDVLVTAEQVGAGKPSPEGFLRAARLLEAHAERCVVVEDAAAGIEAGRAAGMAVIAIGARTAGTRSDTTARISTLHQLTPSRDSGDLTVTVTPDEDAHAGRGGTER